MAYISEHEWEKYKGDFLSFNHCTVDEFEAAYIEFMTKHGKKPNAKAYRLFARKYSISIIPEANLSEDVRTALSVNISAMKVMAKTFEESETAISELLSHIH